MRNIWSRLRNSRARHFARHSAPRWLRPGLEHLEGRLTLSTTASLDPGGNLLIEDTGVSGNDNLSIKSDTTNGQFVLSVELPFAAKEEIGLSRHADEILIDVGSWRRNLVLPRALIDAPTLGAKFDDHVLKIRFAAPPRSSNGGGRSG